jgi:ketosteroid isomerase-like protein
MVAGSLAGMAQAVSAEILDRFKEGFECWNRDELDLMQDMYAEDGVFDVSGVFTDVTSMRGHQDMRRYWNELHETWEGIRLDPLEAFDLGDGRYVVDLRLWGKGQRSGVEVDQRFGMLYTFRLEDGKISRAQLLPDVAAAFSVAESSASQTS